MRYLFPVLFLFVAFSMGFAPDGEKEKFVVLIDAGHGGKDPGASVDEVTEKEIVLRIVQILQDHAFDNTEIVFSRQSDDFISLGDRVEMIKAKSPDLMISLHVNFAESPNAKGAMIAFPEESAHRDASRTYAEQLKEILLSDTDFESVKLSGQNFMVIRNSECASLLVDLGFLSNHTERNYLTSTQGQSEIAAAIARFIHSVQQ